MTAVEGLKPGLFGKHPARGDFVESGLSPAVVSGLERWLDAAFGDCRARLGPHWEATWDGAGQALCFWIGEGLAGGDVLAGVLRPSRDKVGRRYPLLMLVATGPGLAPLPPLLADPAPWANPLREGLEAALARDSFDAVADLLGGVTVPIDPQAAVLAGAAELVAVRPDGDTTRLFADSRAADTRRAVATRSYWWQTGGDETRLYTAPTLPSGQALAWFLSPPAAQQVAP